MAFLYAVYDEKVLLSAGDFGETGETGRVTFWLNTQSKYPDCSVTSAVQISAKAGTVNACRQAYFYKLQGRGATLNY